LIKLPQTASEVGDCPAVTGQYGITSNNELTNLGVAQRLGDLAEVLVGK